MKTRLKTFGEFEKQITIVHRPKGGIKIMCSLKEYVIIEKDIKPWNTPDTRMTFLANLYIKEILLSINPSKRIPRQEGYELLGARCMYNDEMVVICSWRELVDKNTGEITKMLTLAGRWRSPTPFKVLISEVQL